jgi:hypothetical protein
MARQPLGGLGLLISRFHDHTFRHTTVGRTPLDEWPARHTDLYLTTHNTPNRQTSMLPAGFEPTILVSERPKTHALERTATGIGSGGIAPVIINLYFSFTLLGGHQSRSARFFGQSNLFSLQELEPRIVQPVTLSLYRLRHPGLTSMRTSNHTSRNTLRYRQLWTAVSNYD